jgi:hypothetical protein
MMMIIIKNVHRRNAVDHYVPVYSCYVRIVTWSD